jgi:hypothetical protein
MTDVRTSVLYKPVIGGLAPLAPDDGIVELPCQSVPNPCLNDEYGLDSMSFREIIQIKNDVGECKQSEK